MSLLTFASLQSPQFKADDFVAVRVVDENDVIVPKGWGAVSQGVRWQLCSNGELGKSRDAHAVFIMGPGMRLSTSVATEIDDPSCRPRYDMTVIPEWAVST